jgi:ferritin-like metal-binding protein YciE
VLSKKLKHPRQLLVHLLEEALGTEKKVEKLLPKLVKESNDERLANLFQEHLAATGKHIESLTQVLDSLDDKASAKSSAGVEGLQLELESMPGTGSADELGDLIVTSLAARIEHYEIASYETLIAVARALGEDSVVTLLQANLKDEQKMLSDAKATAKRLAPQAAEVAISEVALSAAK